MTRRKPRTARRATSLSGAVAVVALVAGCGGGSDKAAGGDASPTPSASATTTNTVAGCQAAAIRAILAGNLSDPDDGSGDYPECIGLSQAQLNVAADGTINDPAVKKAMAELVDKGVAGAELGPGPLPTLPPDPLATESPAPDP